MDAYFKQVNLFKITIEWAKKIKLHAKQVLQC